MSSPVAIDLKNAIERQRFVKPTIYGGSVAVPCVGNTDGNTATLQVKIQADADFIFDRITMTCQGPTDINGRVLTAVGTVQTAFPMGISVAPGVLLAAGGLQVRILNAARNLEYTQGFIDVAAFATPGYSSILYEAFKLKGIARKNETVNFEFRNRDNAKAAAGANAYHFVAVAMHGERYEGVDTSGI